MCFSMVVKQYDNYTFVFLLVLSIVCYEFDIHSNGHVVNLFMLNLMKIYSKKLKLVTWRLHGILIFPNLLADVLTVATF